MVTRCILLALLVFTLRFGWAQDRPIILAPDSLQDALEQQLVGQSTELWPTLAQSWLQKNGFWLAQSQLLDSADRQFLIIQDLRRFHIGSVKLLRIQEQDTLEEKIGPTNSPSSPYSIEDLLQARLQQEQEIGYPFARLVWQSYRIEDNQLLGKAHLYPGPFITLDSVAFRGAYSLDAAMLRYDLNFETGQVYRESYLQELQSLSQQLEYLAWERPPAVAFFRQQTTLYLYPTKSRNNTVDGVIGLNTNPDGQSSLNGDFQLRLLNTILKKGEELALQWRRPDASVQELNLQVQSPYLFSWPIKVALDFQLFRQDSSFVKTELEPQIRYRWQQDLQFELAYRYRSSNPLSSQSQFTNLAELRAHLFSLGFSLRQTDRLLVPRQGYRLALSLFNGRRFRDDLGQEQYGWQGHYQYYQPLFGQLGMVSGLQSKGLIGSDLALNELYRLGGLKTLRGFNEQSLFASLYAVGTLELRYALGALDYLTLFSDIAYLQGPGNNVQSEDFLTGLGTGINFQTQGGVFSLFFAVGRSRTRSFDFGATKVHFGYANRF